MNLKIKEKIKIAFSNMENHIFFKLNKIIRKIEKKNKEILTHSY